MRAANNTAASRATGIWTHALLVWQRFLYPKCVLSATTNLFILHPDNSDPLVHVVKSAIGQRDARNYETPRQKLNFLSEIISYNLDKGFVDKQNKILENVSLEELSGLAAKHLKLDEMITVVVGDKTAIMQSLQPMFENIVELDEEGKPL